MNKMDKIEELSLQEKAELFRAIASDPDARRAYIVSRAAKIEPLIAKESQVRSIFQPINLAPGAQAQFFIGAKEVQTAWLAPGIGSAPRRTLEGDEVFVNTFPIFARGEWLMDLAADARFDVAQEVEWMITEQVKELENMVGWNLISAAAAHASFPATHRVQIGSTAGVDLTTGKGFFSKELLAELVLAADVARRRITDIYVSPRTAFDIFNYWTSTAASGVRNVPNAQQERFFDEGMPNSGEQDTEYVMSLFGIRIHKVYTSDIVGDDKVYAFDLSGRRSRFGVMPIRQGLVSYEDPMAVTEFKVGYFVRERLGFALLDFTNMFVGTILRSQAV